VKNQDEILSVPSINNTIEQNQLESNSQLKTPLTDTNTPKSPYSPTESSRKMLFTHPHKKKKTKLHSRSNSLTSTENNKKYSMLKPFLPTATTPQLQWIN